MLCKVEKNSMEERFAKILYKYSLSKVSMEEAEGIAPSAVNRFLKCCESSQTLANKGLDWYAKEIAKNRLLHGK